MNLTLFCSHAANSAKRLCVKVVSIRSERGLTGYVLFLLSALVKRSQTTLHTASKQDYFYLNFAL